jgi:nitroimidazol reductase NimA-like FMN-containing flavoprotein (pyridoxamine 5'-phosphate oxidase superfamily)
MTRQEPLSDRTKLEQSDSHANAGISLKLVGLADSLEIPLGRRRYFRTSAKVWQSSLQGRIHSMRGVPAGSLAAGASSRCWQRASVMGAAYELLHNWSCIRAAWEVVAMVVEEITPDECRQALASAKFARLACALEDQPYVVPVYLAYYQSQSGEDYLYGFATLGQKIEWMRANPNVCVEVDDISNSSEWLSVVALGRYEELPNIHEVPTGRLPERHSPLGKQRMSVVSEKGNEQLFAHKLLKARGMWWEPAATVRTTLNHAPQNRFLPVFYKIHLTEISGYRGRCEPESESAAEQSDADSCVAPASWWQRVGANWRGPSHSQ